MELELIRTYFPNGTNGVMRMIQNSKSTMVCYTIELPWLDNKPQVSCIPEGRYELKKRYSQNHGWHLQVMKVKNRDLILIHAANDAMKELKGCIAPVSILDAEGKGSQSRDALAKINAIVFPILEQKEQFFLTIKSLFFKF